MGVEGGGNLPFINLKSDPVLPEPREGSSAQLVQATEATGSGLNSAVPTVTLELHKALKITGMKVTVVSPFLLEHEILPGHPGCCEPGEGQRTEGLGSGIQHWHRTLVNDGGHSWCRLLLCH